MVQLEGVRISDQLLQPLNFAVQACAISLEVIDLLSLLVQVTTHQSLALVRLFVDIALDFSLAVKLSLLQLDELLPQFLQLGLVLLSLLIRLLSCARSTSRDIGLSVHLFLDGDLAVVESLELTLQVIKLSFRDLLDVVPRLALTTEVSLCFEKLALDVVQLRFQHLDLLVGGSLIFQGASSVCRLTFKLSMLSAHSLHLSKHRAQSVLDTAVLGGEVVLLILEPLSIVLVLLQVGLENSKLAVLATNDIFEARRSGRQVGDLLTNGSVLVNQVTNLLLSPLQLFVGS